jgi:3-hydroxybutyrate dehydrogenase
VLTPLVERQIAARAGDSKLAIEQAKVDLLKEKQKLLSFTTPEQIGGMVVFLCSETAATTTGAALSMDGGWVAQ